ncbi:MAG TPA: hypothetical protein VMT87_05755 [Vicinamibacteria bacterium]|nr:hypothetical protein [Vicinamibacteria bacterium]
MNLKDLAGKVRHAVQGAEESAPPEPTGPGRPFTQPPLEATRGEARPGAGKEAAPRDAAKAEARRPDVGRTLDARAFAETEGTGRAVRWKAQATVPDLATVYKEAGIESPLHGYGVDKLTEMLSSSHLASATREVRATAAQVALEAARVPLRDIIDDALLRAKALAAFEADKAFDLQALQMRTERRAQVLRDQVESFRKQKNAEIEELKRTIDAADQALAQLRARKRREEERLHRLVSHFVEPRPAVSAPPPVAARPAVAAVTSPPAEAPAAVAKGTETQPVPVAIKPLAPLPSPPAPAKPLAPAAPPASPAAPPAEPVASAPVASSKAGQ